MLCGIILSKSFVILHIEEEQLVLFYLPVCAAVRSTSLPFLISPEYSIVCSSESAVLKQTWQKDHLKEKY